MQGKGLKEILKSIGTVLGPIAKELGPIVIKELIIPFIKKKLAGGALKLPGQGLSLAGAGKKSRAKRIKNKKK